MLRRKSPFVRHPTADYSCILIDHKEHIVFVYVLGNHLLQVSFCKAFDAVCGNLVHARNSVLGEIGKDQQPPLNFSLCLCLILKMVRALLFESPDSSFSLSFSFSFLSLKTNECTLRRLHLNVTMTVATLMGMAHSWAANGPCPYPVEP